ncbi:MAG TPA: hypothetical protein VJ698_15705 [Noviherbaspirillum sp.]|nr:hypothetical protein [Noviherbaspirillum sp.]HJV86911.1 hypothetical protein [Noviherbaspirillum sp.]
MNWLHFIEGAMCAAGFAIFIAGAYRINRAAKRIEKLWKDAR